MILSTFEHVYIVTQWYLIDFSDMNDNGNVLSLSTFEHAYIVTQWYLIDFSDMNDNGNVLSLLTFKHVYIVTQWYLIDFSDINDNGNILFEILFLSDKLLGLSNMEIAFAADNTAVKQNVAGPNISI